MTRSASFLASVTVQICALLTPCVISAQGLVDRSPTATPTPVISAVAQTVADALSTENVTAAAIAIRPAQGVTDLSFSHDVDLAHVPLYRELT